VAWSLLGLSMAGWNALLSLLIAGLWALSIRKGLILKRE
jgi:disulfide bond formation protein DsbB